MPTAGEAMGGYSIGDSAVGGSVMGDSALGVNGRADAVRADASQSSPLFSPVTIDVFHLPSGVEPAEYATYDVTTAAGVRQLRYPVFNGPSITALARQLTEARARRLAAMSVNDILDVLARAAELWTDPDFELRRQAELLIPAITGYQPDMVRIELKRYMRQFRRRELLRFLDAEIGQPAMLDGFRPNKAGGYSRYVGPRLTYQVFSSNVPGIPVWSMVMTLLVKGAILGKSSFSEPVMPAFFARSIAMIDPELADAIAVVPWKGGSQELEDPAIDAADAVIVYGSSTTTKLIAGKVAGAKPCLGYGAKIGLAFIGREALRPDTYADTVHRAAVDIATYDQQSCLAPQTIFVETGGALAPREVAQLLGGELEGQQRKYPRAVLSDAENMAIQRARTNTEMQALMGGSDAVIASRDGTAWTVLYRESEAGAGAVGAGLAAAAETLTSLMSPLNRTINVVAVPDLMDAVGQLANCRGWLQSCGVAVDSSRLFGLADALAQVGVDRVCPLGEMDRAKSGWHHDGGFNLIDLLRAVDIERGSDTYSDSFDLDME
ncbi:acyl-CoA reductase [Bifidobacterium sp. UTBIF-56]|uniref:acyl-CoA reductase n=1 Tax=Bifidobacterium sp. UTBIF-56 TaxID=1465261 RepID=UPI002158C395|nr:acyl-CoA reductase [Bifidobacterium sp. UTBIF-56]